VRQIAPRPRAPAGRGRPRQVYATEQAAAAWCCRSSRASPLVTELRGLEPPSDARHGSKLRPLARSFERRHKGGQVSELERSQVIVISPGAGQAELERQLQENLLAVLLGRNPGDIPRGKPIQNCSTRWCPRAAVDAARAAAPTSCRLRTCAPPTPRSAWRSRSTTRRCPHRPARPVERIAQQLAKAPGHRAPRRGAAGPLFTSAASKDR
jgi:hypothetical protein